MWVLGFKINRIKIHIYILFSLSREQGDRKQWSFGGYLDNLNTSIYIVYLIKGAFGPRGLSQISKLRCVLICLPMGSNLNTLWRSMVCHPSIHKSLMVNSAYGCNHTNWKDDLRIDGLRKKLCDEMFCFLFDAHAVLFSLALLSGFSYKRSG